MHDPKHTRATELALELQEARTKLEPVAQDFAALVKKITAALQEFQSVLAPDDDEAPQVASEAIYPRAKAFLASQPPGPDYAGVTNEHEARKRHDEYHAKSSS